MHFVNNFRKIQTKGGKPLGLTSVFMVFDKIHKKLKIASNSWKYCKNGNFRKRKVKFWKPLPTKCRKCGKIKRSRCNMYQALFE